MSVSNKADKDNFQDCCFGLFFHYVMPRGEGGGKYSGNDFCRFSFLGYLKRNDLVPSCIQKERPERMLVYENRLLSEAILGILKLFPLSLLGGTLQQKNGQICNIIFSIWEHHPKNEDFTFFSKIFLDFGDRCPNIPPRSKNIAIVCINFSKIRYYLIKIFRF